MERKDTMGKERVTGDYQILVCEDNAILVCLIPTLNKMYIDFPMDSQI